MITLNYSSSFVGADADADGGNSSNATVEQPTAMAMGIAAYSSAADNVTKVSSEMIYFALCIAVLGILYLLQSQITKLIRCCCSAKGSRTMAMDPRAQVQNSDSQYQYQYSYLRRISFGCSHVIFNIRTFVFNRIHHLHGDGTHHCNYKVDESTAYQSWTASQVTHWAYSQLLKKQPHSRREMNGNATTRMVISLQTHNMNIHAENSNDFYEAREDENNRQRAIQNAIVALKRQCIDGKSLECVTLDHLLNFGIAFGVAVQLMSCFNELIPSNRDAVITDEEKANHLQGGGGGLLPSWYESNDEVNVVQNNYSESSFGGGQGVEMTEQAQNIMRDRFGMALPTLRGQDESEIEEENVVAADLSDRNRQLPPENAPNLAMANNHKQYHSGDDFANSTNALNEEVGSKKVSRTSLSLDQYAAMEDIMKSMPPQVRAVAERCPNLVRKLMLEKQQGQASIGPSRQASLTHHRHHHLPTMKEEEEEEEERSTLYHSEEEINIDPESVSLLRRRTNNR